MIVPAFLTDRVVVSQLAALAAVHWCAKQSVAERTANLTLTPPLLTQEDKDKAEAAKRKIAEEKAAEASKPWYRRFFSRKTAVASLPLIGMAAFQAFLVFVFPRITNALVFQLFWVTVCSYLITALASSLLYAFFSGPLTLALKRHENDFKSIGQRLDTATPDAKPFFFVKRNRSVVGFLIAWCLIGYTAYAETNYVLPLFSAVIVIAVHGSISLLSLSTRALSFISAGLVALVAILIPIIFGLVSFFAPDPSAKAKPSTMPDMPQWLLSLMMIGNDGIIAIPTVFLVALALRYDHFGPSTSPALGPTKAAPGEAVPIPSNVRITRPTPLYRTAMTTMALCYVAADAGTYYLVDTGKIKYIDGPGRAALTPEKLTRERSDTIKIACTALVNLSVPLTIALVAWSRGQLKSWWTFSERWVPQEDAEAGEQADVDNAEKALLDVDHVQEVAAVTETKASTA